MRTTRFIGTVTLSLLPSIAQAQSASFGGGVVRDTLSHGVSGALVALIGLNRSDTSDAKGEFRFANLPAGRVVVTVRKVGFQPITDTVVLNDGGSTEREYVLDASAVTLSSVTTMASSMPPIAGSSAHEARFEEHVRRNMNGRFLRDSVLRKNDSRTLADLLVSSFPGVRVYQPDPVNQRTTEYIGSTRSSCDGPVFSCGNGSACPVTLYIDGGLYFSPSEGRLVAATRTPPPVDGVNNPSKPSIDRPLENFPDITRILVRNLTGVEFYAGGTTAPVEYSVTTTCGLLALWTRDR